MSDYIVNEMKVEFLGMLALNFAARHNSASRSVMFGSHFAQRLIINGITEKRVQTGIEQEFSKYTFSVKMPENGRIIRVIDRYPVGAGENSLKYNPETLVLYENDQTREVDCFIIPKYKSLHQFFGFEYKYTDAVSKLRQGAYIGKDTIFADSPCVTENGGFAPGISANVAFMSVPSASEDGVMVSESFLQRIKYKIYETRVVELGSSAFALNLYGTIDNYKPFPEIGEYIREDGVLMMLRTYDNETMPVEMSIYDTMEPDFDFDKAIYARGGTGRAIDGGKGRVIDIRVISNNNPIRQLPSQMAELLERYSAALQRYYSEVIQTEQSLRHEWKKKYGEEKLRISSKLQPLLVEARAITNHKPIAGRGQDRAGGAQSLNLNYRKMPLDEYRIEFVIEYEMTPTKGNKLTDSHGGKAIIVRIEKDENMPVDEAGNRADVVMDPAGVAARMNLGRPYEHYMGAASRDVTKRVCHTLMITPPRMENYHLPKTPHVTVERIASIDPGVFEQAYNLLLEYYRLVSEEQYVFFRDQVSQEERYEHMADICNDGVYLKYPVDNQKRTKQVVIDIQKQFPPTYGPITYVGNSGLLSTTVNKVRIAPLYLYLLDKIADDWSAVSTGKLQHFGVLSPVTKSEKFSSPYRNSPVRTIGETEGRIFNGYCGPEAIAEMMDRSNSPLTQRNVVWNIFDADKPTDIAMAVDRNYISLGNNSPVQLVMHMFNVAGFRTTYVPETHPDSSIESDTDN